MPSSQARPCAPRVYPAGRAAELFGVCEPELAGRRLTVDGRRVVALPYDRFSLLLTYVDASAYGQDELERRRDDASWQAREARVYEHAVERARRHGAVVPLRALTVVPDLAALEAYTRARAPGWERSLAKLGRGRECAVHLFAGPHAALAPEEPYSIRVARRVARSSRLPRLRGEPAVTSFARTVWQACTALARATRRIETLPRRGVLWSAALLLQEGDVPPLRDVLARASHDGRALGVSAYLEGPRAPFSFV